MAGSGAATARRDCPSEASEIDELLGELFGLSIAPTFLIDESATVLRANRSVGATLGIDPMTLRGRPIAEFCSPRPADLSAADQLGHQVRMTTSGGLGLTARMGTDDLGTPSGRRYILVQLRDILDESALAATIPATEAVTAEELAQARKSAVMAEQFSSTETRMRALLAEAIHDDPMQLIGAATFDAGPGHLGMATMRARAQAEGGQLDVISRPGAGTTVVLTFACPVGSS